MTPLVVVDGSYYVVYKTAAMGSIKEVQHGAFIRSNYAHTSQSMCNWEISLSIGNVVQQTLTTFKGEDVLDEELVSSAAEKFVTFELTMQLYVCL